MKAEEQNKAAENQRKIKRVTWGGLFSNIGLGVFKLAAGIIGNSQAVVADSVHTFSDTSTDVALLVGQRYWMRPPDETHPHGHRRIETVVTVLIGLALAAVGVGLIYEAIATIREQHAQGPGWVAFIAAMASIFSKEGIYRWTIKVGREVHSPAVIANAWHHRSDALSSLPAAIAVLVALIEPDWWFVDHIGAIVVSVFIFRAAWHIMVPALQDLVDTAAPRETRQQVRKIVNSVQGVQHVHEVRTRSVGAGISVDLHIMVDPEMTVREGHDIAEEVERRLIEEGPDVVDVVVHLEPFRSR